MSVVRGAVALSNRPSARASVEPAADSGQLALALTAADAGQLDSALAAIEPIIRGDPLNAAAFCVRGLVLNAKGESALALVALRRAVWRATRGK